MCYVKPRKVKTPEQKVFYKVVSPSNSDGFFRSIFVRMYLPIGKKLLAKNVKVTNQTFHAHKPIFAGWGVFETREKAGRYINIDLPNLHTVIIKVACEGRPRKSKTLCGIPCYIFDKITILEDQ